MQRQLGSKKMNAVFPKYVHKNFRNPDINNVNQLLSQFQQKGKPRLTVCYWLQRPLSIMFNLTKTMLPVENPVMLL